MAKGSIIEGLDVAECIALSKVKQSESLEEGTSRDVDFVCRIRGKVVKGLDTTENRRDSKGLQAVFIALANKASRSVLEAAVRDAKAGKVVDFRPEIGVILEREFPKEKKPKAGPTSAKLTVSLVERG